MTLCHPSLMRKSLIATLTRCHGSFLQTGRLYDQQPRGYYGKS
jgi:hypothetical protein